MRAALLPLLLAACATPAMPAGDDTAEPTPDAAIETPPDAAPDDPGDPGPFAVTTSTTTVDTSLGDAAVTVYTPAGAGPFPLVVVSTGFQIARTSYDLTCRHVASWGYLVVSHDYTSGNHQEKAAEVSELIDWALDSTPSDPSRIATAGHSLGGKVSILAAIEDARVGAVVGWDPVDALPPFSDGSTSVAPERIDELTAAIAVLGQTSDTGCAPSADNFTAFFGGACATSAALEVTVPGADHTDWVDARDDCGFACAFCATGTTADATVLAITRRVTVAWLETHLRGRSDLGAVLAGPGAPATTRGIVPGC